MDNNSRQHRAEVPPAGVSDDDLMRSITAGKMDALATLIERHHNRIWSFAYYFTGHDDDADDMTQEAILRIWRAAASYRGNGHFDLWLHRIVANLCMDEHRRRRRGPARLAGETSPSLARGPVSLPTEQLELALRVRQAIQTLPERQRLVVVLHRYQALTHRQIAGLTGWTESAVESLLVRAYARLRESLEVFLDK